MVLHKHFVLFFECVKNSFNENLAEEDINKKLHKIMINLLRCICTSTKFSHKY